MKKSLLMSALVLGLTSCAFSTAPADALIGEAALLVNQSPTSGEVVATAGKKSIRNVAVRLDGTGLTLTYAPEGAICLRSNDGTQVYCRVGDFTPFASVNLRYKGTVSKSTLGYITGEGQVKTLVGTIVNKP